MPDSPTSGVHFVNQEMMNGEAEIQEELQSLIRTSNGKGQFGYTEISNPHRRSHEGDNINPGGHW